MVRPVSQNTVEDIGQPIEGRVSAPRFVQVALEPIDISLRQRANALARHIVKSFAVHEDTSKVCLQ